MNDLRTELDRIEGMQLRLNKRLNAVTYRFEQLEQLMPQLEAAILELSAALAALQGEDASPTKGKRSSKAQ